MCISCFNSDTGLKIKSSEVIDSFIHSFKNVLKNIFYFWGHFNDDSLIHSQILTSWLKQPGFNQRTQDLGHPGCVVNLSLILFFK